MGTYFNSKEVAEKVGLHLKTVQKFMREGKLEAVKIGREWRVSGNELSKFLEGENYRMASEDAVSISGNIRKFDCRAEVEIAVRDFEEASSYSNMIIGALHGGNNNYRRSDFEFLYYEKERRAKLVFRGDALFIADMMLSLSEIDAIQ
ncbi:MAG: helix-turn-helix domain-containing protein [Candidatus Cloacimonetes bacterium]|nr:helix-turn-helix domain-containing protein [Candidatus Cloacimonadota bacterium]